MPQAALDARRGSPRLPEALQTVHLVGACGSGMKALSELLAGMGVRVSGSDLHVPVSRAAWFSQRGWRVHQGHASQHVDPRVDLLVYSPAVGADNPERQFAQANHIPQLSYSQMLGELMRGKTGVCIAGTHGKSTVTAMVGCALTSAALRPSVVVGAELRGVEASGWAGRGPLFVVESCEFNRSFLDLRPAHAAILGIEPDHFDCFSTFDETIAAFAAFARKLPAGGSLLVPSGCAASQRAVAESPADQETFGLEPDADWQADSVRRTDEGSRFLILHRRQFFTEVRLRVPGRHNVLNALAAAALCSRAGARPSQIREGLEEFPGLRRRFEPVGQWRGVTLIDDYAHHPTAVAATLQTAREQFPGRRLWCLFQPHQVSRTRALLGGFADSLSLADETVLVPIFAARERVGDEPVAISQALTALMASAGRSARFCSSLDHAAATLEDALRPGDVLMAMGAGDVGQVYHAFTGRLQRNPHAG